MASPTRVLVPRGMRSAVGLTGSIGGGEYRGTSLIKHPPLLRPYGRTIYLGSFGGPRGGGLFLMSEVPLYRPALGLGSLCASVFGVPSPVGVPRS